MGEVSVLRLGHRAAHDRRISTHVCLTARAFGAERIVFPEVDASTRSTVEDVVDRFGGGFEIVEDPDWRVRMREFEGPILHLTMYGERHTDVLEAFQADEDVLVVVGAEKVPQDVYELATHNVSVGNQPHSEIAALAVLLEGVLGPEKLYAGREDARIEIEPSPEGKRVRDNEPGG